jgi:hypothetical protein
LFILVSLHLVNLDAASITPFFDCSIFLKRVLDSRTVSLAGDIVNNDSIASIAPAMNNNEQYPNLNHLIILSWNRSRAIICQSLKASSKSMSVKTFSSGGMNRGLQSHASPYSGRESIDKRILFTPAEKQ